MVNFSNNIDYLGINFTVVSLVDQWDTTSTVVSCAILTEPNSLQIHKQIHFGRI